MCFMTTMTLDVKVIPTTTLLIKELFVILLFCAAAACFRRLCRPSRHHPALTKGCPDCPVFGTFQVLLPLAITNCGRLRDNLITLSNEGALRSRRHPRYCLPVGSKQMTIMYGVLTQCFNVTILYYIYKCLK